ncbi:hypothetical protein ABPG72_018421 [Tetrahymena utriculariae]
MVCTGGKQIRNSENINKLHLEKCSQEKRILQIINSIQNLANELEKTYSDILNQNIEIPQYYSLLEPSKLLIKLREKDFLKDKEIDEIETKFKIIFSKTSNIIKEASFLLFDSCQNKMISKQNEKFILTFILFYEKTYKLFFQYYDQKYSKKFFESACSKTIVQTSQEDTQYYYSSSQIQTQEQRD